MLISTPHPLMCNKYNHLHVVISKSTEVQEKVTSESKPLSDTKAPQRVELPGLTWVYILILLFYTLLFCTTTISTKWLISFHTASWESHHCEDNLGHSVAIQSVEVAHNTSFLSTCMSSCIHTGKYLHSLTHMFTHVGYSLDKVALSLCGDITNAHGVAHSHCC